MMFPHFIVTSEDDHDVDLTTANLQVIQKHLNWKLILMNIFQDINWTSNTMNSQLTEVVGTKTTSNTDNLG